MSSFSFLDIQYNLSKRKFLKKPSRMFSGDHRQSSSSKTLPIYLPNMQELKQVFNKFDTNKDGKISPEEYKAILKALGKKNLLSREVQKIFEVTDLDGDGYIDFDEFVEVQKKEGGVKTVDLQQAFRAFDKDNDGKITVEEVYELLRKLGERCSLNDCRKMVRAVDTNGDGVIDNDEFMCMMTRTMITY
ncbi:calmodulin-like protein 30 [Primulina huaijiensis]|uniref:calmodulin-like protein 30 n=1 Tax=Primulina huaijiensis TaxID=1492673 RepID=UPI003CC76D24